jgi:hypothetical protein
MDLEEQPSTMVIRTMANIVMISVTEEVFIIGVMDVSIREVLWQIVGKDMAYTNGRMVLNTKVISRMDSTMDREPTE